MEFSPIIPKICSFINHKTYCMKQTLLLAVAMLFGAYCTAVAAPTYCLTNSYGEQTTLTVTGKSGNTYTLSGFIDYSPYFGGTIWPCTGVYNSSTRTLKYKGTNPSPDGCINWASTVTFIYTVTSAASITGTFSNDCGGAGSVSASAIKGSCGFTPIYLKEGEFGGTGTHKTLRSQLPLPQGKNIEEIFRTIEIAMTPNPAASSTLIKVVVKSATKLNIGIYNQDGTLIKSITNTSVNEGSHLFTWNLQNNAGIRVKNGYYIVKIISDDGIETRSLLVKE